MVCLGVAGSQRSQVLLMIKIDTFNKTTLYNNNIHNISSSHTQFNFLIFLVLTNWPAKNQEEDEFLRYFEDTFEVSERKITHTYAYSFIKNISFIASF